MKKLLFLLLFMFVGATAYLITGYLINQPAVEDPEPEGALVEVELTETDENKNLTDLSDRLENVNVNNPPVATKNNEKHERALKVVADGNYLLALVTKETSLKNTYTPLDLEPIPAFMQPPRELFLRSEPLHHLTEMWHAAAEEGVMLIVVSAYRSFAHQKQIFYNFASIHGEEAANRFSARPGQSEHQLGTTVDFGGTAYDWKAAFAETDQGMWLAENASRFGFVLSYPRDSEHITGYIFEPWHFRYIGIEAVWEWEESGLVLSEFLKTMPQQFE